jgi:tetratricopeptide (TPR) repeat protein
MNDPGRDVPAQQHYGLATTLLRDGKLADAERHYRAVLRRVPGHPGTLHGLGLVCLQAGRLEDAVEFLGRAVAATPTDAAIRNHLGLALLRTGRYESAVREFEAALTACADHPAALMGLADAFSILGRQDDARRALERLLAIDPHNAAAHFGFGMIMWQLGRFDDARDAFEQAAALSPRHAAYHRALAEIARFRPGDPRLAALEVLARDTEKMPADQQVELHFALAKALDDLARYDRAFKHLKTGNAVKRGLTAYDEAAVMAFFREVIEAFTPALFDARRGSGYATEVPVFVVGMPRSGTSLIEQILASHPDVFGAGELPDMNEMIVEGCAGKNYPCDLASLSNAALFHFGKQYSERIVALAPSASRIVDKLPANFRHLGLIHLVLPKARIIHVRRDPADTCCSCYSKLFLNGLNYTYDLGELGRYYKAYQAVMAHWHVVLPDGAMLEVCYESLVENFREEARRIVDFCGLEWDERCTEFHHTSRPVRTLSGIQVRQPLFDSSIGRWRNYAKWLQPLLDALR